MLFKYWNLRFLNRYIDSKNRANLGFKLAANHLTDKNLEEIYTLNGYKYSSANYFDDEPFPYNVEEEIKIAPENFDWRINGAVTPVKGKYIKFLWFLEFRICETNEVFVLNNGKFL